MTSSSDLSKSIEVECQSCGAWTPGTFTITEEMVERAARAWWAHESDSDVAWADVIEPVRNGYRARARESLSATFSTTRAEGDDR